MSTRLVSCYKYGNTDAAITTSAVQIIETTMRERFHQSEISERERLNGQEG